jgi:hypothetical protein
VGFQFDVVDRYFSGNVVPQDGPVVDQEFHWDQHAVEIQPVRLCHSQVGVRHVIGQRALADDDGRRGVAPAACGEDLTGADPDDAPVLTTLGYDAVACGESLHERFAIGCGDQAAG